MGTRFRPSDPDAVRQRFAAIRARALERVDEEQRAILAQLVSERESEKRLAYATVRPSQRPGEGSTDPDDRRDPRVDDVSHAAHAADD
jgi:hypothetical protein